MSDPELTIEQREAFGVIAVRATSETPLRPTNREVDIVHIGDSFQTEPEPHQAAS